MRDFAKHYEYLKAYKYYKNLHHSQKKLSFALDNNLLIYSIKAGNYLHVLDLALSIPNLDLDQIVYTNDEVLTPLTTAIRYGHFKIAELLLAFQTNPNSINTLDPSPIFYALQTKHALSFVKLLIRYKADVSLLNREKILKTTQNTNFDFKKKEELINIISKAQNQYEGVNNFLETSYYITADDPPSDFANYFLDKFAQLEPMN